ncbi:excinuclease ABC subunit UvrC [Polluticaenibacter yanchengensis]|uniref:UvrABC system protein C n=1 Tax=Polluticaenibacter yanchengensis TaxID=3014562 RepID=A0ABT4UK50_9BACT|nr:excinuclease ABC subunit UvrC [Chitinophagaceae bacterium LY-5]
MTTEEFRAFAPSIPHDPGIYKYFNKDGVIIYVGKAKDLRKRVSSYFNKTFVSYKTNELVRRIHRIEFTIVNSEQDAFFLENSLIKEFRPKYNISLKDDKTYPYIVIKKEPFPRVFFTRRKLNDGSEYLGPYTSVMYVRELLQFIKQHIPLRTCKLALTDKNIKAKKFKVCLEYHLGNCKGPCEGKQSEQDYNEGLQEIKQVLKGKLSGVQAKYKQEMQRYVEAMEFEKAGAVKKKLEHLQQYQSKSIVVGNKLGDLDVFTITKDGEIAFVNYLMLRNSTVVQTHTIQLNPHLDETEQEVLAFAIAQMREDFNSDAAIILLPFELEETIPNATIVVAKTGDRKKLLELSLKNAEVYMEDSKRKRMLHIEEKDEESMAPVLEELQQYLHLPVLPTHIECFDNSNLQGSFPVSAMVCFKNGLPSKGDYRRFNVKTVEGINDFATMYEVVHRRYKRLKEENLPMPKLVIIDGGKGQLGYAMQAIKDLGLLGRFTVVGLAKNEEELFFPGDSESFKLPWDSDSLKLVRRVRDEVHRFGITFHRNQRSKGTFKNELEDINGIGKSSADNLLKHFKSIKKVREATEAELTALVGAKRAKLIIEYFKTPEVNGEDLA